MPKDIFLPSTSEITTENRRPENEVLKFPKKFNSDITLELPVTIPPGGTLVLDGPKLDKKPYDIDLVYTYFNDTSTTDVSNVSTHSIGNYKHQTELQEKRFYKDVHKQTTTRLFNVSEEEKKGSGDPLLGRHVNQTSATHLFHGSAIGSDLAFKDFDVDLENNLKLTYENIGTTPIVLNKPISMEPLIPPQEFFKVRYNQIVKCFGNKVLVCSKRFGTSRDPFESPSSYLITSTPYVQKWDEIHVHTVTNGQITSSENISNVATFRCTNGSTGFAGLSNVITWSNPTTEQHLTYGTFAACENIVDADEYFVAFTTYNNKVIFYDSKTGWENKTGTSITDTPTGLLPADYSFTYRRADLNVNSGRNISEFKRPMSIKHFQSTGKVHALVCGASSNSCPNIAKSTDNLETFVSIFNEANLAASNITPYGSGYEKSRYDTQTDTKIINENTFYVETGLLGKYDDGTTNYTFPLKLFLKTTDGGTSWVDIMEDHLEYRTCGTSTSFISEDGQDIYVAIFYHDPSNAYLDASLKNKIQNNEKFPSNMYPSTTDRIILFNYSTDGGASWRYTSGNWKTIDYDTTLSSINNNENIWSTDYTATSSRARGNMPFIFRNKNTGQIIMSYVYGSQSEWAYLSSTDNGNTWNYYLPGTSTNPTVKIPASNRPLLRFEADSSTWPVAPYDYTDEHVVHIGNHYAGGPENPGDPNTVYNRHDLLFTLDHGASVDVNRLPRSMIVMSKLLDNIIIDKVSGYHT